MKKLIYGKGYNSGNRPTRADNKCISKEYTLWKNMLRRCFCEFDLVNHPTYSGYSISNNFLNYTYFYDWCQDQIGFGKDNWQIDKDILFVGNKIYSEDVCVFVPQEINKFFTDRFNHRGEYPVGVSLRKEKGLFQSRCAVNGKDKHLGYFNTPQEAFLAYKPFKENLCKELAMKWKSEIDPRVFNAMMNWQVQDD